MAFDKPQSRNEAILQNMLGANNELEPPKSRVEALLQELSGKMPEANPSEGTTTGTLERLKIGDEIYTVEGGGSGTSDYDALNNKPQIAGTTLSGNKSLADLGIASASAVSDILNGTDIDSFGDVETALAGKQGTLTFDSAPTSESTNPVTSGGVYTALAGKVDKTSVGVASGVAELDSNGKVPSAQLPSYVDDVVNGYLHDGKFYADDQYTTEITGEEGKIYVDLATNKTYRWSGLAFVEISESLALGETSSTAYAGDKGKANADAISAIKDGQTIDSFADVESALAGKQDTLTFDNTPTENSTNPVKSGGIYSALAGKADTGIVADDFDSTASYVIGNYCIENGKLYRFKANHSGTWSSADVDEIQITGELATLKSGFTNLDSEVNGDATTYPYADVITIPDAIPANVADCTVKIESVQDLHGYDKPWVGGASKNKLPLVLADIKEANKSGTWSGNAYTFNGVTFTVNTDNDGNVTGINVNGTATSGITFPMCAAFVLSAGSYVFSGNSSLNDNIRFRYNDDSFIPVQKSDVTKTYESATTIIQSYIVVNNGYSVNNITLYPMIRLATETDATFAPYTNICPITGHTEASVQRDGRNLIGEFENGGFDSNGLNGLSDKRVRSKYYVSVQEGQTYTFNANMNGGSGNAVASISLYTTDDYTTPRVDAVSFANCPVTFTVPNGIKYVRVLLKNSSDGNVTVSSFKDFQLELGSTATPYVPYAGQTYTIALGDTIYGGSVDFNTGLMTVTHQYVTKNTSTMNNLEQYPGWTGSGIKQIVGSGIDDVVSTCVNVSDVIRANTLNINDILFFEKNDIGLTQTELIALAIDVAFVVELATPTTIQLTPQQIQLLKGTNTLTASTGQISVTVNGVSGAIGAVQEQVNDHEERIEDLESGLDTVKSGLTNVSSTIEELQAYTGYSSTDIIGIEVDYVNKSFRRLGAAVDKNGGTDFDAFPMFGGRRRCNVADDGTISQYYGDTGYAEDGSNGQVMVYQPKFYYKVVPLKLEKQSTGKGYHIRKAAYYVTATPMKGFKVHPAFVNASGNEVDYILVGASKGCIYDVSESAYILDDAQVMDNTADKFSSIFGVKPASGLTQDLTRPKIEQMCQNRGANWHELNVQMASMTQLLMLIEYGKFDMQRAIGKSVVDITDNGSYNCAATSGSTSALGNASGRATSTTIVTNTSTTYTDDGKTSVTYRGEEDPYGDMWEFVMGMNIYGNGSMNGGEPYICSDYDYAESKNTDNYKGAGFTVANSDGYVNAWGYGSEDFDWLFIASEVDGSDALPVGDYLWKTANMNGYRIARLGVCWDDSWKAGGFCWYLHCAVGYRGRSVGGRLAYIPA